MLFNSVEFLLFFPIVVILYYLIPHRLRYIWLLASSYFFYMCWNPAYIILIMFSTLVTYFFGIVLERLKTSENDATDRKQRMKICVAVCLILNLFMLGYFKYINFILANIGKVSEKFGFAFTAPQFDILLPVGISFYTFQALGYIIDIYRDKIHAEKNVLKYALFVSFFPQLVAGPIERSENLLRQINEKHRWNFEQVRDGLMLMLWGFFLKLVIADRIAIFVDAVYADVQTYYGWYLVVASILFAFQIYCDFAGYSTIAMGAAKVMGFQLTDNFIGPYFSRSVAEFWRRWHVTLSSWFRDYLYISLGGNRKGKLRKYLNIMIVFSLSGLWHGAQWNYVLWGMLNGIYQVVGELTKPIQGRVSKRLCINKELFSHKLYQMAVTFLLVDFSLVLFRSKGISGMTFVLQNMFRLDNIYVLFDDSLFGLGLDWKNFMVMLLAIGVLMFADGCKRKGIILREVICRQELWFRWSVLIGGIVAVLVLGIWGSGYDASTFIYFQF